MTTRHCEQSFNCKHSRPCTCACESCRLMPMTDERGMPTNEEYNAALRHLCNTGEVL